MVYSNIIVVNVNGQTLIFFLQYDPTTLSAFAVVGVNRRPVVGMCCPVLESNQVYVSHLPLLSRQR